MKRIAIYIGASGRRSTYPLRDGCEAPTQITAPSGELRALHMVEVVEDVELPLAEMAVAA